MEKTFFRKHFWPFFISTSLVSQKQFKECKCFWTTIFITHSYNEILGILFAFTKGCQTVMGLVNAETSNPPATVFIPKGNMWL